MKTLISTMLITVAIVFTRMHLPAAGQENYTVTVWEDCGDNTVTVSAFQRNLNQVLESLVKNVSPSGFNVSSVVNGQNINSSVYGLAQCRGDLGSSDCKECVTMAKAKLVEGCHNTSGSIQLNGCFLRYENHSFYNDLDSTPKRAICDARRNGTRPPKFTNLVVALLLSITTKASQSPKQFAADSIAKPSNSTEYVYSIAQCWRDLTPKKCGSCLTFASSYLLELCPIGSLGAQFGSENCYLRYQVYEFFNTSIIPTATAPGPAPLLGESPPVSEGKRSKVLGITLGVVAAAVGVIAAIGFWKWNVFSRTTGGEGEISLLPNIANPELIFKYEILKHATSNFKAENKLGDGGFGSVFKGVLPDGREVAVKRLYMSSRQGNVEFLNEVNLISRVQHRNLVKLLGCSTEGSERLLVYEYLRNSSLDKILFDTTTSHIMDWRERYEIIVGTARGLAYLHEESEIRIIHRDIKASNILLDNNYRPKIADFGLAKLFGEDQSHVSTRVAGTLGYMAPEYALRGQLTEKADVFSFGVLVLEIISGRKNQSLAEDMEFLIERAWRMYNTQRALEVIDPTLEGSYSWEEGIRVIKIGLLCAQATAALRPSMSRVVSMLTSEREHLPSPTRPAFVDLNNVLGVHLQVERATVTSRQDPGNTSSSTQSSEAAKYDRTPPGVHSAAADPSSGILEPR